MSGAAGPRASVRDGTTLTDLVAAGTAVDPAAVAVIHRDEALTYGELEARADRLAGHLHSLGVGPDVPVGVLLERSTALAVGLLGVLKSGGACMPLDPSYPVERLALMIADAGPPVILTRGGLGGRLPPAFDGHVVHLDADLPDGAAPPPAGAAGPEDLGYVIYTSGSTGEPKGVMLTHRGLVDHGLAVGDLYALGPGDRVLQFCSIGFDVSIEELFPTWARGGTVVMRPDDEVPILGREWLAWLRRTEVTVMNLPTAYWHAWARDLEAIGERVPERVRLVVVGGEQALGSVYRTWLRVGGDRPRWLNAYGPAEASVTATVYEPPSDRPWPVDRDPPVGEPIASATVQVLDDRGEPVPAGGVGELHIGGGGLARGYLGRPELTAEAFAPDPRRPGQRLYRTGDLMRMLHDGNLEFVGRADEQVKVRGFRVECHEVERAVARHPEVAEVAVIAREDEPGERHLVAYVVATGAAAPTAAELRRFLSESLPHYMVPGAFKRLDALPLTPNGKVDRDALPPPGDPRDELAADGVAPRGDAERTIAAIWSRVLGIEPIGAEDDFFELGGHSLQAVQVLAELHEALGVELGVRALFEAPTVARLAALAQPAAGEPDGSPPLTPRTRSPGARIPLTLSQEHMWQLETNADPKGLFNVTVEHRFAGAVDEAVLRRALAFLTQRHEALRMSFHADSDGPYQRPEPSVEVELAVSELTDRPAGERERELHTLVEAQDALPFDLARAPLLRAHLYRLGGDDSLLAVTFDHLVCDGTSLYIFLNDLAVAYEAFAAAREPALRRLPVQYGDFALWQRGWLGEDRLSAQLEYWKRKLAGMPLGPAVPFDRVPDRPSRRIATRPLSVTADAYDGLRALARTSESTVFVVTVAAVQSLFSSVGGGTDIVLSTTLSGRQRAQLEGLIGCFQGIGRIRTDLSGDPTFEAVVARTRETALGLFEHQDIPFMRVRKAVLSHMPRGGPELLAAVPIELQYFHTSHEEWTPGAGVVEQPGPEQGPDELFFRGHLHPLALTFLDDGTQLWGELSYKIDYYDAETIERLAEGLGSVLAAVTRDPGLRLSQLPVPAAEAQAPKVPE